MRRIPDRFLRDESRTSPAYQSTPTGELDVIRLVNGDPRHWISPKPARRAIPKKLILADWQASLWDLETTENVYQALKWLLTPAQTGLEEGFEIYALVSDPYAESNPYLYRITLDSLESIRLHSFRASISAETDKAVKELAYTQLGYAVDEIHTIDDADRLINLDPGPYQLRLNLYRLAELFSTSGALTRLFSLFELQGKTSPSVLVNSYSISANMIRSLFSKLTLAITINYQHLCLDYSQLNSLLTSGVIRLSDVSLNLSELVGLKLLQIEIDQDSLDLKKILQTFNSLTSLKLSVSFSNNGITIPDFSESDIAKLESLTELEINFKISGALLISLIRLCPNLQRLKLTECESIPEELYSMLPNLRELELTDSSVSAESLTRVLTVKQLTELKLKAHRANLDVLSALEPNSAQSLVKFTYISDTPLASSALAALIKAATKMRVIDVSKGDLEGSALNTLTKGQLANLEHFTLGTGKVSSSNCGALLRAAPNLISIKIDNTDLTPEILSGFERDSLSRLRSFQCDKVSLSAKNMIHFLEIASNLIHLRIGHVDTGWIECCEESILFKLKTISLCDTTLSEAEVLVLLKSATHLSELTIGKVYLNGAALTSLNANSLKSLKKLKFSKGSISSHSLFALFRAAINVEEILFGESRLNDEVLAELHPNSLPMLKTVDLGSGVISPQNLLAFFKAAPNIKDLIIDRVDLPAGSLRALTPNCLSKLDYVYSYANMSYEDFLRFLTAAPNLRKFHFSSCDLSSDSILELGPNFHCKLFHLDLKDGLASLKKLPHLLKAFPQLRSLSFFYTSFIDDELTENLDTLEVLRLWAADIKLVGLANLLNKAHCLDSLIINNCRNLSGSLEGLLERPLISLRSLSLEKLPLSPSNLIILLKACPNLTKLELDLSYRGQDTALDAELDKRKAIIRYIGPHDRAAALRLAGTETEAPTMPPSVMPNHDLSRYKSYRPTDEARFEFKFSGANTAKNQSMLIERFSHYCTLSRSHRELIPKIQDGICSHLTRYFLSQSGRLDILEAAVRWNGTPATLDIILSGQTKSLREFFEELALLLIENPRKVHQYVGDNLTLFCDSLSKPCIFSNTWHEIAIYPITGSDDLIFYNPNSSSGPYNIKKSELVTQVETALGRCVSVCTTVALPEPKIADPRRFIREGGLISLTLAIPSNFLSMYAQLGPVDDLDINDLQGILLRTTIGTPAWALAFMEAQTQEYAHRLINEFIKKYPTSYIYELRSSLDAITPSKRQILLEQIRIYKSTLPVTSRTQFEKLLEAIDPHYSASSAVIVPVSAGPTAAAPHLATTVTESRSIALATTPEVRVANASSAVNTDSPSAQLDTYFQSLLSTSTSKKILIELDSAHDFQSFGLQLNLYCNNSKRPVFYINSPDDLICSAPYIYPRAGDGEGEMRKAGGPLYDFLKRTRLPGEASPILIINYDNFAAEDLVRFNSILDVERKVDNEAIPNDMTIIGFRNARKPDCYTGSDFTSRFDFVRKCSLSPDILHQRIGPPEPVERGTTGAITINLFHADDWKARLLGRWILNKGVLSYEEGELVAALSRGRILEIQNGPWNNPEFMRFWLDIFALKSFSYVGRCVSLPEGFQLVRSEGYDWAELKSVLQIDEHLFEGEPHVLNSSTFTSFFYRYELDTENDFVRMPGFLDQVAENSVVPVHITSSLSADEWAMLLNKCKSHGIKLNLCCSAGVKLPAELDVTPNDVLPATVWDGSINRSTLVIQTNDVDTTTATIIKNHEAEWVIIEVSECQGVDLLERISGGLNQDSLRFQFTKEESALIQALRANKNVILKGHFSSKLADDLADFLLKRQREEGVRSKLVLISEDAKNLQYTFPVHHKVSSDDKLNQLAPISEEMRAVLRTYAERESVSQLKARRDYLLAHPDGSAADSDSVWIGMHSLSPKTLLAPLNPSGTTEQTRVFNEERKALINRHLAKSPYVFIAGQSGVGKTTFINSEFCEVTETLFVGEDKIIDWAQSKLSTPDARKILFIDEVNLSERQWSEFEGLFSKPPHILINGKLYELSDNHKVIFAGNPISYGGGRKLASFFKRHGNAILFEAMPTAVIYESILKPIFEAAPQLIDNSFQFRRHGSFIKAHAVEISKHITDVYRFLIACSEKDILISPRELQMMALLIVSYCATAPSVPAAKTLAQHFAYQIALPLVPKKHQRAFEARFKPSTSLHYSPLPTTFNPSFSLADSRKPLVKQLHQLLMLRKLRHNTAVTNEAILFGGLGGIIIEGSSGNGKSELVIQWLRAHNFKDGSATTPTMSNDNQLFYRLPVSLAFSQKKELLLRAFDQGAIVVVDEFNSSMMEDLLNQLLMGFYQGKRPSKPGFMIIGTQNPISMAGRRVTTASLARRLMTYKLPDYTSEEVLNILLNYGLNQANATALATQYHTQDVTERNLRALLQQAKQLKERQSTPSQELQKPKQSSASGAIKSYAQAYRFLISSLPSLLVGAGSAYGFSFLLFPLLALHLSGTFFMLAAIGVSGAIGLVVMGMLALSLYQLTQHWWLVVSTQPVAAATEAAGRLSPVTSPTPPTSAAPYLHAATPGARPRTDSFGNDVSRGYGAGAGTSTSKSGLWGRQTSTGTTDQGRAAGTGSMPVAVAAR